MGFELKPIKGSVPLGRALARGAAQGLAWGVLARVWMRLIAEDPEFTWGGSIYIVAAATIFGLTTGLASAARRNRWRAAPRRMVSAVAGGSVILLGMGAGSIALPTIVFGGLALGRTHFHLAVRLVIVVMLALVGVGIGGVSDSNGLIVGIVGVAVVGGLLIAGYRPRAVIAAISLMPAIFVVWTVLFDAGRLPMWQRLGGAVLYVPLMLPLAVWFARTVSPLRIEDEVPTPAVVPASVSR